MINWDANPDDAFNDKVGYFTNLRDHKTRQEREHTLLTRETTRQKTRETTRQ